MLNQAVESTFFRFLLMHQAGLLSYADRKSRQVKNPCSINNKSKDKRRGWKSSDNLQLRDFGAAFMLLGLGFGCAIVILVFELVANKIVRMRARGTSNLQQK